MRRWQTVVSWVVWIAVGASGCGVAGALAAQWEARLEPWSNLRWWWGICLAVFAVAGWWCARARRGRWAALGALALAVWGMAPGLMLFGPRPAEPAETATVGKPLRVGSTNLLFGIGHPKPVAAWMAAESLDVVGFVEVKDSGRSQLRWSKLLESWRESYPYQFVELHPYYGMALLSRVPLTDRRVQRSAESHGEEQNRPIALHARLQWDGEEVLLTLVHPPRPQGSWRREVRGEFFEALATNGPNQGSWIVFGDFNTTEGSPWFRRLTRRTGLVDSRRGFGRCSTWSPAWFWLPLVPLDHILVRGPHVMSRGVGPSVRSDHRPVHATLVWPKTPDRPLTPP